MILRELSTAFSYFHKNFREFSEKIAILHIKDVQIFS